MPINNKKELLKYVHIQIKKGMNIDEIKQLLQKWGYPKKLIDETLNVALKDHFDISKQVSKNEPFKNLKSNQNISTNFFNSILHKKIFYIILVLIILLSFILLFFFNNSVENCSDLDCFLEKANKCEKSSYIYDNNEIIFEVSSNKFGDNTCQLTKKVIGLPSLEPSIIKEAILNKELKCIYNMDEFNQKWINTLLGGLNDCEGELKNSLYEIAIAQYEVILQE
ncbi:hypothetical protein HN415_08730 [Candidatus Woesearchaeota archaeon]|jgi:hypothetical protein|nr:hypothetical protein [Candidatus Woesearchaeota archaeon]